MTFFNAVCTALFSAIILWLVVGCTTITYSEAVPELTAQQQTGPGESQEQKEYAFNNDDTMVFYKYPPISYNCNTSVDTDNNGTEESQKPEIC